MSNDEIKSLLMRAADGDLNEVEAAYLQSLLEDDQRLDELATIQREQEILFEAEHDRIMPTTLDAQRKNNILAYAASKINEPQPVAVIPKATASAHWVLVQRVAAACLIGSLIWGTINLSQMTEEEPPMQVTALGDISGSLSLEPYVPDDYDGRHYGRGRSHKGVSGKNEIIEREEAVSQPSQQYAGAAGYDVSSITIEEETEVSTRVDGAGVGRFAIDLDGIVYQHNSQATDIIVNTPEGIPQIADWDFDYRKKRQEISERNHQEQVQRAVEYQMNVKLSEVEDDANNLKTLPPKNKDKMEIEGKRKEAQLAVLKRDHPEAYKFVAGKGEYSVEIHQVDPDSVPVSGIKPIDEVAVPKSVKETDGKNDMTYSRYASTFYAGEQTKQQIHDMEKSLSKGTKSKRRAKGRRTKRNVSEQVSKPEKPRSASESTADWVEDAEGEQVAENKKQDGNNITTPITVAPVGGEKNKREVILKERLDDVAAAVARMSEGKNSAAEYHYEKGTEAYAAGRLQESINHLRISLDYNPENGAYRKKLREVGAAAGTVADPSDVFADVIADQMGVEQQRLLIEIERKIENGLQHRSRKEYAQTTASLNMALVRLQNLPFDNPQREAKIKQVEALLAETGVLSKKDDVDRARTDNTLAQNRQKDLRQYNLGIESRRIEAMLGRAKTAHTRKAFDEAILYCESILKINPSEARAHDLLVKTRRERHVYLRSVTADLWDEEHLRLHENIADDLLPQLEIVKYSDEWQEIDAQRLSPRNQEIGKNLSSKINVNFQNNDFQDAFTYIGKQSDIKIILDPNIFDKAELAPITMEMSNVRASSALEFVCQLTDLKHYVFDGVVYVSNDNIMAERAQRQKEQEAAKLAAEKAKKEAEMVQAAHAAKKQQPLKNYPVNPWVMTKNDGLSTFAIDIDSASYKMARNYIQRGYLPPAGLVRMEEFVNAFDYNYSRNGYKTFTVHSEAHVAPYAGSASEIQLLKIGIKGKVLGREERKPAHIVLAIDTSGSMAQADRLPLIQHAALQLLEQLAANDRVTLISYGRHARLLVEAQNMQHKAAIKQQIENLQCDSSTDVQQGLHLAYEIAARHFQSGSVNRVVLCSDGVANFGSTTAQDMLVSVQKYKQQGISCTTVGVGQGVYNDALLERLANSGDGSYLFVDSRDEAQRIFGEEFSANMHYIAQDVKIQVQFDPAVVRRYRLIGYENRAIADKDFRNDSIDAGEVGSGQSATALYEIELVKQNEHAEQAR
ncbi:MAG: von Willebrand factor type A domain-containing protein, partial [Planctomycetes bacterium]|nr:von Willebrand factor type A domain-containing protein [Planctomycetota bacterium]